MHHTLKQLVSSQCQFSHYRAGVLYYFLLVEGFEYILPIDITDTKEIGSATFERNEKGILFMRYIRKAIKDGTLTEYKKT